MEESTPTSVIEDGETIDDVDAIVIRNVPVDDETARLIKEALERRAQEATDAS